MRLELAPGTASGYRLVKADKAESGISRFNINNEYDVGEIRATFGNSGRPIIELFDGARWIEYAPPQQRAHVDTWTSRTVYETGDLAMEGDDLYVAIDHVASAGNLPSATPAAWKKVSLESTPWTAVTFENSWENLGGFWQTCQYRKVDDMVQLRGACTYNGSIGTATTLFILPVGFRPALQHVMVGQAYNPTNGYAGLRFDVMTDGRVVLQPLYELVATGDFALGYLSLGDTQFSIAP